MPDSTTILPTMVGVWRFAGLIVFVAALLLSAACGASPPSAATPTVAATGTSPIAVAEETSATQATSTLPAAATATPLAVASLIPSATFTATPTASPTPLAPIAVTVKLLGQQWGRAEGVAVEGEVAYAVIGPRLVALDVTDPTAPVLLGQSDILPGLAAAVVVDSGVAYVAAASVIVALDVTDPTSMTVLSQVDMGPSVTQLALAGDTLIAGLSVPASAPPGSQPGGISTLDVSTPGQLRLLDHAPLPWPVYALAADENMVYAAHPTTTDFYALDISDPADLPDAVAVPGIGLTYSLSLAGDVLVAGGGVSDLHAWDVSDPLQPQPLWEVQAPPDAASGLGVVEGFVLAGERALLAAVDYNGNVIGVLPVALPAALPADAPDDATSSRLVVADGRAFFARGDLTVYDVAGAPAEPLGRYELPAVADVAMTGDVGIALAGNQLLTLGLPDLAVLGVYTGEVHCRPCYASYLDVALAGDVAYVSAADDGLRIIGLTNPSAPALLGSLDATTGYAELRVGSVAAGQLVYLAGAGVCDGLNLLAFDLADPAAPRLVEEVSVEGCVAALDVDNGRLYAAGNFADRPGGALTIFTESAAGLELLGLLAWPEPISSVRGLGDLVLVGTEAGLEVVSVADPTHPVVVAALPIPGGVHDIAVAGSVALVTNGGRAEGGLWAIDLRQPSTPQTVGGTNLPAAGMRVAAGGEYGLVGSPGAGVGVWSFAYE